jgi:hypothetical protein
LWLKTSKHKETTMAKVSRPTKVEWDDEKYPDDSAAFRYEDERDDYVDAAEAYMDQLEDDKRQLAEALKHEHPGDDRCTVGDCTVCALIAKHTGGE